jgi:hypothetical protein
MMAVVLGLAGAPAAPAASATFRTGFGDPLFTSSSSGDRERALNDAVASQASIVRIPATWSEIAPKSPPAGFDPNDPSAAGYRWASLDAAIASADAHGLEVLLFAASAPRWAEAPGRPSEDAPGTWKPDPASFEAFAHALATRYSGGYSESGTTLPAVHLFEAWNEPNLATYLNPQWENGQPVSADIYRNLLNAFYAGVKSAQPTATVVGGSLAPFGDRPGGQRVPPVTFTRELFCFRGGELIRLACPRPAHLDVFSHHPIAVGSPTESAASEFDATTPDLGRLTKILEKAESTHQVLPAGHKELWVTEFWYDSNPPDPTGVPIAKQARWYEQDLYSFWKQGASVAICLQVIDSPEGKSYASSHQAGVYFVDGAPKPSQTAMAFPFVAHREGPFKVGVWGIAPGRGKVRVQALRSGKWKTIATVNAKGKGRPFTASVELLRFANLRAKLGSLTSLNWSQQ